jgi:methylated-DNA-[protein]-cysteine S-methyltransferase
MCEISYFKINSLCGELYITYAQIDNSTFPLKISFIEPINYILPKNINYASFIPENEIPISNIEKSINDSISGKYNDFNPVELLNFYKFTHFQYEVYKQLIQIPRGNTISYRQLAAISGNNNASRAVGNCMKKNPFLILVPCHRVIKSDGTPGGFNGNTHLKISLLAMESIFF